VPEAGVNCLTNGGFEASLDGTWTVSTNMIDSGLSTTVKHSGKASLHVVASSGGATQTQAIWQDTATLVTNATYTLSYWYLPSNNGSSSLLRLRGSGPNSSQIYCLQTLAPSPASSSLATPGAPNSSLANLPSFPSLWLNEIEADNRTGLLNRAGLPTPWVELYNPGTNTLSLDGLFLSSSYSNSTAWPFPTNATIGPGEFKVVFADGLTNLSGLAELHTSFSLASGSGSLALAQLDGQGRPVVVDYLDYSNLPPDHTFGSLPDGQSFARRELAQPTPGTANYLVYNQVPVFAPPGDGRVYVGQTLTLFLNATDADRPPQRLTYSLAAGAPAGAQVDPATGRFSWTPSPGQVPSVNPVTGSN